MLYGLPDSTVTLEEAISWSEHLITLEPDEPIYHAHLAILYEEANRSQEAEQESIRSLLCPRPLDDGWIDKMKLIFNPK